MRPDNVLSIIYVCVVGTKVSSDTDIVWKVETLRGFQVRGLVDLHNIICGGGHLMHYAHILKISVCMSKTLE